jgi:hypothetical protein
MHMNYFGRSRTLQQTPNVWLSRLLEKKVGATSQHSALREPNRPERLSVDGDVAFGNRIVIFGLVLHVSAWFASPAHN